MSFEVKDLTGLGQPVTKLLEIVAAACGAQYKPRAMRNEADAKAYERIALAKADAEAEAEKIKRTGELETALAISNALDGGDGELIERAKMRLIQRELEGQKNIESIVDKSIIALPLAVSSEPVSPDWRRKFFLEAENICAEDLQELWAKVLAGEVGGPGRFSLRSLEALKHLSQDEAERFRVLCSLAMQNGWVALPGDDLNVALVEYGIDYNTILVLRDAGLLLSGDNLCKIFRLPPGGDINKFKVLLVNNGVLIEMSGPPLYNFSAPALVFSRAGIELQALMGISATEGYLRKLGEFWRARGLQVKRGRPATAQENAPEGATLLDFQDDL